MATVGSTITANNKVFTVRELPNSNGICALLAFQKYKDILIRHKDLDFLYANSEAFQKNQGPLVGLSPVMSRLVGASSIREGKVVPLGDLERENGVFYVEGSFDGKPLSSTFRGEKASNWSETTRFYLFTEGQAKQMGFDLKQPAFAAIEDGYNIVDIGGNGYAIHVPENALPSLRLFYGEYINRGSYASSPRERHIEQEFNAPLGKTEEGFDPEIASLRMLFYFKPGPAFRGASSLRAGDRFQISFGVPYFGAFHTFESVGILTEDRAR